MCERMVDLLLPKDGPLLATEADANDYIGEAWGADAQRVVFPASRLSPEFFRLSSGLAGAVLQKFSNYGLLVAIVGDISAYTETSEALRDFVRESNKRGHVRFIDAEADL